MSSQSVFEVCQSQHGTDLSVELLQCVSDAAESGRADISSGLNSFFLIYAGALVFFMQLGFAMLCAGSIREKNVKNVLLWNLLDSAGGAFGFWSIGFAFAYGGQDITKGKTFIGNSGFFLTGDTDMEFWFFQYTFACALSSIVAGTIAERTKMMAYLCYSIFLCGFVYPVCAHAFWSSNGFLSAFAAEPLWGSGVIDFAGSGPVHMCGGVAALVMAIILGPRRGRFYDDDGVELDEPKAMGPHSVALQFLGTFALWFGWYGFNPGSSIYIATAAAGDVSSLAAVNTTLGSAAGALSGMFTSTIVDERKTGVYTWDTTAAMNGCLTGLVAITAGCATVEPWAAFVIGLFAGWIYLAASSLMIRLKIDDAVDAIPVHMFGGMWGVIATGLFTSPGRLETLFETTENVGWFYEWGRGSGNFTLLGCQLVSVLFVLGWSACIFAPFCMLLKALNWLRIDPLEEEVGMDISRHKGPAYESEGSAKADAVAELSASRRDLMNISNSMSGKGKSFGRDAPKAEEPADNSVQAGSVNDA
jgi:Amt family ammonium transporter